MHSSLLAPSWRRVRAVVPAAALVVALAAPLRAATTELADDSGVLRIDAPGKWREQKGDTAITASGFLGGAKRAELFGVLYDDLKSADAAARRWKDARTKEGGDPTFTHTGDTTRWTAHSASSGTVEYVRALAGADRAAVVWVRLNGAPERRRLSERERSAAPVSGVRTVDGAGEAVNAGPGRHMGPASPSGAGPVWARANAG